MVTKTPEQAPDAPEYVKIDFEQGVPVAVNGQKLGAVELITTLNEIGARNGVGIVDIVENRLVGMKSRGIYETRAVHHHVCSQRIGIPLPRPRHVSL